MNSKKFINISKTFSTAEFEKIKNLILAHGDRQTYRNYDNNNPHYDFAGLSLYLGVAYMGLGQKNINNDAKISGFNQLVIADSNNGIRYYQIVIVRKGDIADKKSWIIDGMKEGNVYLVKTYGQDLEQIKGTAISHLKAIKDIL